MADEWRTLRERQRELARAFDRLGVAPQGAAPELVKVFQQTTIPTTTGKFFACHPVTPSGTETEGGAVSFDVVTGSTVFVLVVGGRVPVAGDYLVAKSIGGRWVAEGSKQQADCTHVPDQLYLAANPWTRPFGSTTPAKVPFTYDSGSGLWLCAVQAWANTPANPSGGVFNVTLGTCLGSGTFTYVVFQMNSSFLLTLQQEACRLNPGTGTPLTQPENSAPGSLSGSLLFGPAATTISRGTYTSSTLLVCSAPPLLISGSGIQVTADP